MKPYKRQYNNFILVSEKVSYIKGENKPNIKTIDFLWHGTNFPSSLWVTKNNKLKTSRINLNRFISLSTNIKYFLSHHVPIRGEICILWKLDFQKMIEDKIPLQLNTQNIKRADSWEVLLRDKILNNFSKYVVYTYIFTTEVHRFYQRILKTVQEIKENPGGFSSGTTVKSYLKDIIDIEILPKSFDDFLNIYVNKIKKQFGNVKLVNKNIKDFEL
jgi:hypothetical protein